MRGGRSRTILRRILLARGSEGALSVVVVVSLGEYDEEGDGEQHQRME